jgi:hypothetical protein
MDGLLFFCPAKENTIISKEQVGNRGAFVATDMPFIWLEVWRWVIRLDRTSAHMMKR